MKEYVNTNSFLFQRRTRENLNFMKSTRRWSFITPMQIVIFWILAKCKDRYIFGFNTILFTISLHYGARSARHIIFDFVQKKILLKVSREDPIQPEYAPNIVYWSMPDAVKYSLEDDLAQLKWDNKDSIIDTKVFIQEAKGILKHHVTSDDDLTRKLRELCADGRSRSTSIDAIVFENLPLDPYVPPTPTDESRRSLNKPTHVSEAMLMAMGELAGTYVVGYKAETEYSNPWAHEGFPRLGAGGSALTSTAGMLDHHQDMSYQRVIPDILGLTCVREGDDPSLKTTLVSTENIVQFLPRHVESILRQKRFKIVASAEWIDSHEIDLGTVHPRALLEGTSLHLPVRWESMIGIDSEASQAIESLQQVLLVMKPSGIHLRNGEMVLFNNQKVVHGRTPYRNLKYDGISDRVIIRSYFAKQLNEVGMESRMI